jgi:hypothetical protein
LHNELFNKTDYIDDKLNDEILKLMTQKTKQINNNYELIKSKITLRESSFRNGHKDQNTSEVEDKREDFEQTEARMREKMIIAMKMIMDTMGKSFKKVNLIISILTDLLYFVIYYRKI